MKSLVEIIPESGASIDRLPQSGSSLLRPDKHYFRMKKSASRMVKHPIVDFIAAEHAASYGDQKDRKMSVNLQIVGIFYSYPIDVSTIGPGPYSVKQILDLAMKQTNPDGSTLTYFPSVSPITGENIVEFISANYVNQRSSPVSGNVYSPATYALKQNFTDPAVQNYTIWQYYISDQNNVPVPAGDRAETPFDKTSSVQDGYNIIWRLVTICGTQVQFNARLSKFLGAPFAKSF